ncbi:MAG: 50S ribosomal protein L17 [Candidatus Woykebacteria bacterium RBG_13_40_15]|uniref:Large ribosomal subunit protein bL17 n=1 Tax=Candidatus Woykebacteria bacterium RBG_13_40_15 TaxID=1802593 RepID=A0A1G1W946_9BACT|nr:MAG: 50S ribosomal protein L17 [Candidatus Woykebacteria bacterium RBG_13_40_15]
MIHRVSKRKFSRDTNARKALLKNLANELILHERITTTQARAKSLRPFLEKLVTKSKNNTLSTRRLLISRLGLQNAVGKLLDVIGPIFKERPGGYTRIIKLPSRTGDNAEMAVIEFVENVSEIAAKKKLEKPTKEEKTKIEVKEKPKTKKIVQKKKEVKPKEKTKK